MYEMYQNHTFLIFEFMYLCNPNIQKEEMYDSSYISYIGNFRESVNFKLTIFDLNILAPSVETFSSAVPAAPPVISSGSASSSIKPSGTAPVSEYFIPAAAALLHSDATNAILFQPRNPAFRQPHNLFHTGSTKDNL